MRTGLGAAVVLVVILALGVASTAAGTRVARGGGAFASEEPFAFFAQKKDGATTGWAWFFLAGASPHPIEGRVKCLAVKGTKAAVAGTLTAPATLPGSTGTVRSFALVVEDLGAGGDPPTDVAGVSFSDGATPPSCSLAMNNTGVAMASGDVTVR